MPKKKSDPSLQPASAFLDALQDRGRGLKDRYRGKPLELAKRLGLKLPEKPVQKMIRLGVLTKEEAEEKYGPIRPGLREWIEDVCNKDVELAAVVASRGGGKSQGVSFIEFFLVVVEDFDALNLGGSEFQAEQVYSYLVVYFESDPYWKTLIKSGEPMRERTDMKDGNWIQVLAASPKSTRSRHAGGGGGKVRGGILVIDEEAEAEPGIVNSALPTVNTANPSITVRSSTFHKAVGSFQELIDNHVSMGYKLYFWDIIDVAQRCDCIGSCQNPEPCFREDHVEEYIDPEETDPDKQMKKRLVHRAYSFVGQEVVIVKSPTGKISCTTLKNLYRQFSEGSLGAERIPVPPGWEIFDHVEPPARWKSSVQWTPLLFVSRHRPKVGLRNIQLGSGDSLTVTDDHPFMLKEERTNKFVRADKVRLGDVGVVTDVIGHLGSTTFSLPSSVAYLIGQFLAEGNCGINAVGSKWVTLSGLTDPTDIENAAKKSGFRYRVRPHSGRGWDVHFGAEFYDLLRSLGLGHETAVDKRLPENILEWSLKATGALLSGLIDGDGTVQHSPPSELLEGAGCSSVTIRVTSKALVSQVQLCLRKLGMSGWTSYVGFYETGFEANYPLYRIEFSILEKKLRYFSSSIKIDPSFVPRTRNHGKTIGSRSKQVRTIKTAALGQRFVYDVTTGSETFWCSGIRTHNCGGRAMYADGWISIKEIVKLWMSMNRNHSQWEVEAMGSRPSTSGYVIKDHTKLAENVTEKSGMDLYIPGGGFITVCVDWGTVAAGIEVWQEQFDIDRGGEKHVLIACEQIEQAGLVEISSSVMGYVMQFIDDFQEVAADIGGGGNYLNPHLRTTYNIEVRDVNFNQEKESGIAAFNILSENNRIVIPQQFELMISQLRRWRRNNGGQVMKGNDHLCDAMVCNFSKFVDRMGISVYRVLPQTFNAGGAFSTNDQRPNQGFTADNRVPIAFGFGSSSR